MSLRWLQSLFSLRHTEQLHDEIAEEREFHIAMAAAELMRCGISPAAAQQAARKKFGPALSLHEEGFEARAGGFFNDCAGDIRVAFRMLRKAPVKTAALLAALALGIGINAAVFSLMKSVVFDPLPFAGSNQLVVIHQIGKGEIEGVSYPNFEDWRQANRSFEGLAVYAPTSATLTTAGLAQRVNGAVVSANLFHLLRVTPLRGRLFTSAEDQPGSGHPVIISDTLWRSRFQASEQVLGQPLTLDGVEYRVAGVIASRFAFPIHADAVNYWTTVAIDAAPGNWGGSIRKSRGYPRYEAALARLKPGVTLQQAQAEMTIIAQAVARQHPALNLKEGVNLHPAVEDVVGKVRPFLWILYGAVSCVLAAACANAATLLLVGAIARRREFALRAALGAASSRLVRQLLLESAALAVAAGVCGAGLASVLVTLVAKIAPPEIPRLAAVQPDGAMLLYTLALSLITGLIFGIAPAAASLQHDLAGALKDAVRSLPFGRRKSPFPALRPGSALIAVQLALSMMLAGSAAILTGSFWRILFTPRGFDAENVLTASISLPPAAYPQGSAKITAFYAGLIAEMRRVPGIAAVSAAESLPLSGQNNTTQIEVIGSAAGAGVPAKSTAGLRFVEPDYFHTLGIPLLAGRFFSSTDHPGQPPVALVNRAFARRFLRSGNPVGAQLLLGWGGDAPKLVAGVVGDIRHNALDAQPSPEVYVPVAQFPLNGLALIMRIRGDSGPVARLLRERVRQMDASVPVEEIRTLHDYLLLTVAPQRFLMWVLVAFAASTLLLAAVGLYGALSFTTACRKREFGIRMALGSGEWGVMRLVLREGAAIAVAGMSLGLVLMVAAARFLSGWLFETSPLDGPSLIYAGAFLFAVAAAACWIPARRATQVSPITSLRGE